MKSERELAGQSALSLAHGGAYTLIDAINPDGTLVPAVYRRLGSVRSSLGKFADVISRLGARLAGDVGLYFSIRSHVNVMGPQIDLREMPNFQSDRFPDTAGSIPQRELLGASIALSRAKIPNRIITEGRLDLNGLGALVIPNCGFMPHEDVERVRAFVESGGTLIATGLSSLYGVNGGSSGDFQLADVFGVSFTGKMSGPVNYLRYRGNMDEPPNEADGVAEEQYILADSPSTLVEARGARCLATISETRFPPHDPEHFVSIHSDPPGEDTLYAGLAVNTFGQGTCIYLAAPLLASRNNAQLSFMELLLRRYAPSGIVTGTNVPRDVELTVLGIPANDAWIVCLVNRHESSSNGSFVSDLWVDLCLPSGASQVEATLVSNSQSIPASPAGRCIRIHIPRLENLEIVLVRSKTTTRS
jgi:hypothetical protein